MTIALLFWILMLGCCAFAAIAGGWEGRWFAGLYCAQSVLIVIASLIDGDWKRTNWPVFTIDVGLLFGFIFVALRTRRFWPLWVLGFHFITLSTHVASAFEASVPVRAYFLLATMWAVPKLVVAVFGIALDRRAGLSPERRPIWWRRGDGGATTPRELSPVAGSASARVRRRARGVGTEAETPNPS